MVRAGAVKVAKAGNLKPSGPQTEGMSRMNVFTGISDQLCGTSETPQRKTRNTA